MTYRWALPEDFAPLQRLIGALGRDEIDLVAFTSASQASNLLIVAQYDGKEESLKQSLSRTLVASIGPVCSVALRKLAVRVDIEAKPPKLGPFVEAINAALSDPRRSFDAGSARGPNCPKLAARVERGPPPRRSTVEKD